MYWCGSFVIWQTSTLILKPSVSKYKDPLLMLPCGIVFLFIDFIKWLILSMSSGMTFYQGKIISSPASRIQIFVQIRLHFNTSGVFLKLDCNNPSYNTLHIYAFLCHFLRRIEWCYFCLLSFTKNLKQFCIKWIYVFSQQVGFSYAKVSRKRFPMLRWASTNALILSVS